MNKRPIPTTAAPVVPPAVHPATTQEASAPAAANFADGHVTAPGGDVSPGPLRAHMTPPERAQVTLEEAPAPYVPAGHILIVCGKPGFRRAGVTHPTRAEYPLDYFTQHQLDQLLTEPELQVVAIGGTIVARYGRAIVGAAPAVIDPLLAGRAAADAVAIGPNRSEPGLRNHVGDVGVVRA